MQFREFLLLGFFALGLLACSSGSINTTNREPDASTATESSLDAGDHEATEDGGGGDEFAPRELAACKEDDLRSEILSAWDIKREYFRKLVAGSDSNPYNLYNVQIQTNPLFTYATLRADNSLVDDLLGVYLSAYATLDETDQYTFYYFPDSPRESVHKLDRSYRMWLNDSGIESELSSSQFLYLVSQAINYIASIPVRNRSSRMNQFVQDFVPVVAEHFRRWVLGVTVDGVHRDAGPFQVRGWGCKINGAYVDTGLNHQVRTRKLLARQLGDASSPRYCNAVLDTDLWIYAAMAHYLAAHIDDPVLVPVSNVDFTSYAEYLHTAVELLRSRTTYQALTDFSGKLTPGAFFDLGVWDDHENYAFSGYTDLDNYPDTSDDSPDRITSSNVGWDVSHARRFVEAFRALYQHRDALELSFPDREYMQAAAAALAYKVFNGDFKKPLFSNFMDGTNDWYRVGYSGRKGFGYGPGDMSSSALNGGYGLWMDCNRDLVKVFDSVYEMLFSTDPEIRTHVMNRYERNVWSKFARSRSFDFSNPDNSSTILFKMQFYPSICR